MRGSHSELIVTTTSDPATGIEKPLFSFPVQICTARESTDVSFSLADEQGFEVEQVYRSKGTGEIVERDEVVRGVREGDMFSVVSQEDIDAIKAVTAIEAMTVERSMPLDAVPVDRVCGTYYLQAPPKKGSGKSYEALRQGLRAQPPKGKAKKGRPALGLQVKFMTRSRQKLGVVYADEAHDCLSLMVLDFVESVREPDEVVTGPSVQVDLSDKEVGLVRKVVEGLASDEVTFDTPVDEALAQKRDLVEQAVAGKAIEVPEGEEPEVKAPSQQDLEAILEASLA